MEEFNLHLTGDIHAITAANNVSHFTLVIFSQIMEIIINLFSFVNSC